MSPLIQKTQKIVKTVVVKSDYLPKLITKNTIAYGRSYGTPSSLTADSLSTKNISPLSRYPKMTEELKTIVRTLIISALFLTAVALCLLATPLHAADCTLTWDKPTTNADGSPLTDLQGYEVYQREGPANFDYAVPIATINDVVSANLTHVVTDLVEGHYKFIVLAVDTGGNKSYSSNEAGVMIVIPPTQPANLQAN